MLIKKNNLLNKILVCGASLVMLGSTATGIINNVANAKSTHTRIHHIYHHRKHHINNRKYYHYNNKTHYLAYNQLIPTIKSVYHQLFNNGGNETRSMDKQIALVDNTIRHNAKRYNHSQIMYLLNSDYTQVLNRNARKALNNATKKRSTNYLSYTRSKHLNVSSNQETLDNEAPKSAISNQPVNFLPTNQNNQAQSQSSSASSQSNDDYSNLINLLNNYSQQVASNASSNNQATQVAQSGNNDSTSQATTNANLNNYNQQLINAWNAQNQLTQLQSNNSANQSNNTINNSNQQLANNAWNNRGNNNYANQIAQYEYQYINQVREQNGLKPLPINGYTQEIANMRSKQYTHDMEHYNNNNNLEQNATNGNDASEDNLAHGYDYQDTSDDDAQKLGIKDDNGTAENADVITAGYTYDAGDSAGDKTHYENNDTPQEIAYNDVNDMVNYDKFSKNGHRNNILDPTATGVGISSYYHSNKVQSDSASNYAPINGGTIQDYSYGNNPADV